MNRPKTVAPWPRGRPKSARLMRPDVPYTMKLPDGRIVYVEVPGRWVVRDRTGEIGFTPEAVKLLDRVRALAADDKHPPTPGYLAALRQALGLTQAGLGGQLGVDKLTVSRWERGAARPGPRSMHILMRLKRQAVKKGVVIAA